MQFVLTLIADPESADLDEAAVAAAAKPLTKAGAALSEPDWLAPEIACDLCFTGLAPERAEVRARSALKGAPVDLGVQPKAGRRKSLLVADMDSTIVTSETLDELADRAGLKREIAAITARAMAGELDFAQALRQRVAMLGGLPATALDHTLDGIELSPGARTLVQTMKAAGAYTMLVSGGFTHFTAAVRESCGFDRDQANRLVIEDGRIKGEVAEPILDRQAKLRALQRLTAARGLEPSSACTVGDGANDIDMLRAAGLGVAYRAKPAARAAARFKVDHGDLTALLYLQGFRQSDFRT